jgi:hypothetical protein
MRRVRPFREPILVRQSWVPSHLGWEPLSLAKSGAGMMQCIENGGTIVGGDCALEQRKKSTHSVERGIKGFAAQSSYSDVDIRRSICKENFKNTISISRPGSSPESLIMWG